MSDFIVDMARKLAEGERRQAREDAEAVLAYYEMTEKERSEYDRKVMNALLETMGDGMTTTHRVESQTLPTPRDPILREDASRRKSAFRPLPGQPTVQSLTDYATRKTKAPE